MGGVGFKAIIQSAQDLRGTRKQETFCWAHDVLSWDTRARTRTRTRTILQWALRTGTLSFSNCWGADYSSYFYAPYFKEQKLKVQGGLVPDHTDTTSGRPTGGTKAGVRGG